MMTENNTSPNNEKNLPQAEVKHSSNANFSYIWWLPLIALTAVAYLVITRYTSQGPLITIRFETAEGIEVNKTKLRYKDVNIGEVEKISLDDDYHDVLISVRLNKANEGLLREKSQFWVVRPRISVTRVSGLSTLLSGAYIAIDPDKNTERDYRYEFRGLNSPPVITQDKPGLRLTLLSSKANALTPGTAVYFKGMQVGSVDRVYFSKDYLWVKADIFIASPHNNLIKQTTKFWSASGLSIEAGANGFDIEMESVETLLAGGIVFETPETLQKTVAVSNGTEYILYDNKKQASEQNYGKKIYYVTYFKGNLKGLTENSAVMIQGIKIGKVKDIQLLFNEKSGETNIPVLFEIYENRLGLISSAESSKVMSVTKRLVEKGMNARIETANLLTGAKYISLVKNDDSSSDKKTLLLDSITGYPIIPSVPESFDELTAGLNNIIAKVNKMPLNTIAENINKLIGNVNNKVDELELKQSLTSLNDLLKEGKFVASGAKKTISSLNKAISNLSKSAEAALEGFSPDAPLYYNLNSTLNSLNEVLESLRVVTDMLERKPNALIFGEDK